MCGARGASVPPHRHSAARRPGPSEAPTATPAAAAVGTGPTATVAVAATTAAVPRAGQHDLAPGVGWIPMPQQAAPAPPPAPLSPPPLPAQEKLPDFWLDKLEQWFGLTEAAFTGMQVTGQPPPIRPRHGPAAQGHHRLLGGCDGHCPNSGRSL